ncbi:MAG: hypothetical protein A2W01_09060 [Candidatus Solincola sediminis]|uniref:Uncharacterized protein n=1 Tax=Candidatus Solincola sediminis TaxID=1797199 RepID=A0A1F2WR89_9ACTN|nr:MAG: hypothetical protein A2Y75_11005 [Candidatus Solincola sediminis]OFW60267.1 MAG: hypothetical protein A2W01_09060 [Candidatus Solincola sediminis]
MKANDWWKTASLFLWLYETAATGLVLLYFFGICRLAERRFEGRAYAFLLLPYFLLMSVTTLIFATSTRMIATDIAYAIWPGLAGILLFFVVYRTYRLMMG